MYTSENAAGLDHFAQPSIKNEDNQFQLGPRNSLYWYKHGVGEKPPLNFQEDLSQLYPLCDKKKEGKREVQMHLCFCHLQGHGNALYVISCPHFTG